MLVDRYVDIEAASAATRYAVHAIERGARDLPALALLCKAAASDAAYAVAAVNVQVHGAIGFTWEHEAGWYFKRAATSRHWLGDPHFHRKRLTETVLDRLLACEPTTLEVVR
jgi:alkylation response protein AidB-like acyl-CoA dehydrogenase